jgi:hypothetical protein
MRGISTGPGAAAANHIFPADRRAVGTPGSSVNAITPAIDSRELRHWSFKMLITERSREDARSEGGGFRAGVSGMRSNGHPPVQDGRCNSSGGVAITIKSAWDPHGGQFGGAIE